MDKKLVKDFLVITFAVMIVFWGGCALISQTFDLTVNNVFLRIMHMIGGFSPTIASYASLKMSNKVKSFKEWLKSIFDVKHGIFTYALVTLFTAVYYAVGCAFNGFELGAPAFMLIIILPMMLFGGGNEEVGWRMILQPQLEKSFGFYPAVFVTAVIWWIWHLPIFFIKGTANSDMNYLLFGIMCLTLSCALATVRRVSNGVFPCILMHCLINGLSAVLVFEYGLVGCLVSLALTFVISLLVLTAKKRAARS